MMRGASHAFFVCADKGISTAVGISHPWDAGPKALAYSFGNKYLIGCFLAREVFDMRLEFIEAGEIVNTHGIRGEVKVLCWLDDPEMLCEFDRCRIQGKEYTMEQVRVQKTCNLVKLQGIDTMEDAQKLRGKTVELYREDIDEDVIFAAELVGVEVFADGVKIGRITEVLDYPGNSVYVVKGQYEYMIPAVKQFIMETNMEENSMQVKLIEGMRSDEN